MTLLIESEKINKPKRVDSDPILAFLMKFVISNRAKSNSFCSMSVVMSNKIKTSKDLEQSFEISFLDSDFYSIIKRELILLSFKCIKKPLSPATD
ncbi:hypothetical protein BpHYR1_032032 [Brachionus plicatilis]|uniref:Uncharacterized protein n=1 Tax=Brachionus plicatilis TaxID=10195 RepID=A0A3M7RG50_BRAPC|nr:hypothetical protein BpHYR1_032032 [Brachionus plicatilis]